MNNMAPPPDILYLHPYEGSLVRGGSDIRIQRIARCLSEAGLDVRIITLPVATGWLRRVYQGRSGLVGIPPSFGRIPRQSLESTLGPYECLPASVKPVIIAGSLAAVATVPKSWWGRTILDSHNVESDVIRQTISCVAVGSVHHLVYRLTTAWAAAYEAKVGSGVAGVMAVSRADSAWFEKAGAHPVVCVPNGTDMPDHPVGPSRQPMVIFVGSLRAAFNRDGMKWFLSRCWPGIQAAVPEARCTIVGSGGEDFSGPGIIATGRVQDLRELMSNARFGVVPILQGSGSRLKVPELLSWQLPCVSTSVGAAGHDLSEGEGMFYANDPPSFIKACVRLLVDYNLATCCGAAGRAVAEERLSWSAALTEVPSFVRTIIDQARTI